MKIIIYSANIDNYDYFHHPKITDKNINYILFTDNKYFKSKIWEVYNIDKFNLSELDDRKRARYLKINSHLVLPDHDISIWIDYCLESKIDNVSEIIEQLNFKDKDAMIYKHSFRNCIYDEARVCIEKRLDKKEIIENQMEKYKINLFPKNYGLFETGVIFRKNNQKVIDFNNLWWQEVLNGSGRDQLSQSYASWKLNFKIDPINIGKSQYDSPFLNKKEKHIKTYYQSP